MGLLARAFVQFGESDASERAVKASAANCAVLPKNNALSYNLCFLFPRFLPAFPPLHPVQNEKISISPCLSAHRPCALKGITKALTGKHRPLHSAQHDGSCFFPFFGSTYSVYHKRHRLSNESSYHWFKINSSC